MDELLKIKGIGPAMLQKLHHNQIFTLDQLIDRFPAKYEYHRINDFSEVALGVTLTLKGTIIKEPVLNYIRKGLTKLMVELTIEDNPVKCTIFNREYLRPSLKKDTNVVITGKFEKNFQHFIASDMVLEKNYIQGIIPIYNQEDIGDKVFSKLVQEAIHNHAKPQTDPLPNRLIDKNNLLPLNDMRSLAHQPTDLSVIESLSKRIKYDELLRFGLRIAVLKRENDAIHSIPKQYDIDLVKQFIKSLPFELTEDQKMVTNDIFRDMKKSSPMLRLLQGDVGSGKTVCATIAAYAVITAKEQVAIMAPTEILAYQHYQNLSEQLKSFGVTIVFLSSSVKGEDRFRALTGLANGKVQMVIGTHSLIQEDIVFKRLGFVIIDEQHRFGVEQRKKLRLKGYTPDVLLLSATPIPRTLSIAIFGDMDISSIKSMPIGRKPIITKVSDLSYLKTVLSKVDSELISGKQAYFIVPVIEGKTDSPLINVDELYQTVRKHVSSEFEVQVLHGKMKSEDKTKILDRFAQGEIGVLVATTVVEVGLNAKNATIMCVVNAERFGLSQLHQLRGRVGRSHYQAYCYYLSDQILMGNSRLDILEKTTDGFAISEEDLRQRGPGEVFGSEQTGIPKFRMANLIEDEALLHIAFEDAKTLLTDPDPLAKKLVSTALQSLDSYHLD